MKLTGIANELDALALFAEEDAEMERLQAQAEQLRESQDKLGLLLDALKAYEQLQESGECPSLTLYSDGSGHLETMSGGLFCHFSTPEQAIAYLRSAVGRK